MPATNATREPSFFAMKRLKKTFLRNIIKRLKRCLNNNRYNNPSKKSETKTQLKKTLVTL